MDTNVSLSVDDCNAYFANSLLFNTLAMCVCLCVGVVGNCQVLYLYRFKMPRTEERFFIPPLAIADLLSTMCIAWLSITGNYYHANFPSEILCKLQHYFSWVTTSWSASILLMISISRYLKICRPTGKQMTLFGKKCAVLGCLFVAVVNTSPLIYFAGYGYQNITCLDTNITIQKCGLREFYGTNHVLKKVYMFFEMFVMFCNIVVTASLYVPIGYQIYKRFRKTQSNVKRLKHRIEPHQRSLMNESEIVNSDQITMSTKCFTENSEPKDEVQLSDITNIGREKIGKNTLSPVNELSSSVKQKIYICDSNRPKKISRVRNMFTYMFITIIFFYLVSYLPTFITIILSANDPYIWYQTNINTLSFLLLLRHSSIINHIVNPFIYGYFDRVFQQMYVKCFICKPCCRTCIK